MKEAPASAEFLLLPEFTLNGASGRLDAAARANKIVEASMIEIYGLSAIIDQRLSRTTEALPFATANALAEELVEEFGARIEDRGDGNLVMSLCAIEGASYGGPRLAMLRNWQLRAKYVAQGLMA